MIPILDCQLATSPDVYAEPPEDREPTTHAECFDLCRNRWVCRTVARRLGETEGIPAKLGCLDCEEWEEEE